MVITDFELLDTLAVELNLRKTAERMFVSQPALSQRLQSIEREWGTPLFIRSTKGMTLTEAGEIVVQYARESLKLKEKTREKVDALKSNVQGTLKIASASIVGQYWLPKVLKKYVKKYPNVKISLVTGWSSEMIENIYNGESHIGILRGVPDWHSYKRLLFSDRLYLVDTELSHLSDALSTERPFILFKSDSNYYREIQNWWIRHYGIPPTRTILVDQIETCKQMVMNGIGYAILPGISLREGEASYYKHPLHDLEGHSVERKTWLVSYDSSLELRQVKAFVDLVEEMGIEQA
mgnify:CR=1 FL=1